MRITTYILFVLILSACAGCTIVRDFCGSAANLKSHGEWIPPGTHLKMNVACSGSAPNGDRYIVFNLRHEGCWLVLFHPPLESGGSLRTDTTTGHSGAWLVRGKKPDCATLTRSGRDAQFLADRAERLRGSIEILWRADDNFYVPVELMGETGDTAVQGQFAAYSALWDPLVGPALLVRFGGAGAPKQ